MSFLEILQSEWAVRALLASSMVGVMCGVLGCFIVLRNMSLIGDALSHAILPGVVFGFMIAGYSVLGFFVGSVIAGLFAAVAITWIQQNVKTKNDAAIGIVFTAMFSIGVMAISSLSRSQGVHLDLQDFLFGNVLGVSNEDLYLTGFITLYVLASIVLFFRYLFATTFQPVIAETMGISVQTIHYFLMLLLSFAVVASLKTVGVILVVAMLITPAATALLLTNRLQNVLWIAAFLGLFSAVVGLFVAIIFETTPGPAMTVVATLFYLLAMCFAPDKGLIFKYLRQRKIKEKIILEDILKNAFNLEEKGEVISVFKLAQKTGISERVLQKKLNFLTQQQLVSKENGHYRLNVIGREKALQQVRAHRLWETYFVEKIGLKTEQIHEEAEHFEHLLNEELLNEMEERLGFPTVDPHGSPIPKREKKPLFALSNLPLNEKARITAEQINEHVASQLWALGLLPEAPFVVNSIQKHHVKVTQNQRVVEISKPLADKINVVLV